MDMDLLITFIEIYRTRHFGRAAENLYITQSTASARIRLLEAKLGVRLFTRVRNNIQLTPAGQRLLPYAETILTIWARANQEILIEEDFRKSFTVSGTPSLWDTLLSQWLHKVHKELPLLALNIESHSPAILRRKLLDGSVDLAFMFDPPQLEEFHLREIATLKLIMVSTVSDSKVHDAMSKGYIFVDWGTSFSIAHAKFFPEAPAPEARISIGRLALDYMLTCGGAAYFAESMVKEHLDRNTLHRISDAPTIDRIAYAAYPINSHRNPEIEQALKYFSESV
jgi:DNA-binding transcriptional LysR family regulator